MNANLAINKVFIIEREKDLCSEMSAQLNDEYRLSPESLSNKIVYTFYSKTRLDPMSDQLDI